MNTQSIFKNTSKLGDFLNRTYEPVKGTRSARFAHETFLTKATIDFCNATSQYSLPAVNISLVFDPSVVSVNETMQLVQQHNDSRVPIYIAGDVRNKSYEGPPLMPAFRSTDKKPLDIQPYVNMVEKGATYSVWGNCQTLNDVGNLIDFVSIHAWGVNFESNEAVDSRLILKTDQPRCEKNITSETSMTTFYNMSKRMWVSIIQAGIDSQLKARKTSGYDSTLVILTPAIGCGAYLSYLTSSYDNLYPDLASSRKALGDKYWDNPVDGLTSEQLKSFEELHRNTYNYQYMTLIFKALNDVVQDNTSNMKDYKVVVRAVLQTKERNTCMAFEENVRETTTLKRAKTVDGTTLDNLFTPLLCNEISSNGMNLLPNVQLSVVNAWDTFSWIGNGGSRDASVDGFYVAGWLAGKTFVNNSYLLNSMYTNNFR